MRGSHARKFPSHTLRSRRRGCAGSPFFIHNVNFTTGDTQHTATCVAALFVRHRPLLATGDDNIAVHANHTLLEDSYFGTGHGASIGSMCNETITNLTVRNVTFRGTSSGCRYEMVRKLCQLH